MYEKHHEDRTYLAVLAEELPGGFTKGQVSSQLRKLGLKKSKAKKARGTIEVTTCCGTKQLPNKISFELLTIEGQDRAVW